MKYPFEVPFTEVEAEIDLYISSVFSCLESEFLVMPKGEGFVDYPVFERGYEFLKRITNGFRKIDSRSITEAAFQNPMVIIVLRTMLGFTPPEWACVTTQRTGVKFHRVCSHPGSKYPHVTNVGIKRQPGHKRTCGSACGCGLPVAKHACSRGWPGQDSPSGQSGYQHRPQWDNITF